MAEDSRFAFLAEWYDPLASIVRSYQLFYFAKDSAVEMFDLKLRRPFLKKIRLPELRMSDFYVGNSVNILSRKINLVDFADDFTRRKLSSKTEKTLVILPLTAKDTIGRALEIVAEEGLLVANLKTVAGTAINDFIFVMRPQLCVKSCSSLVMELVGSGAMSHSRRLFPAAFVSESQSAALKEVEHFFGGSRTHSGTATMSRRATCALIRPHAFSAGMAGRIVSSIVQAGFSITAARVFHLDRSSAEEFLEIYKGVVNEHPAMVAQLTSGPCLVMEVTASNGDEAYSRFRDFVGPPDPEIARHLRPDTLRARFGEEKVTNAVHCTDLPEDTVLELQYFFQLLDN